MFHLIVVNVSWVKNTFKLMHIQITSTDSAKYRENSNYT